MIAAEVGALAQVVGIDLLLAGDNAIAIGALAATVSPALRRRALALGVVAAVAIRIVMALGVSWLFGLPGIELIGGVLLLGIAWKLGRETLAEGEDSGGQPQRHSTFGAAVLAIIATDVSLSLDNVLGVAGAARGHPIALAVGLVLSIALMGVAATIISKLIERHRWVAWVGVALIAIVAVRMIVAGAPAAWEFVS